ncbi:MAG: 23S rRNA pseudouridine1911/1915/1917 synthase [Patiriisocius sp.]
MTILETYIVPTLDKPIRLSDLRGGTFTLVPSRKAFTKRIKAGLVQVNNQVASTATPLFGQEIICIFRDETPSKKPRIELPLEIIFEDEHLAIIYKPAGIEVSGNKRYTVENALANTLSQSRQKDALERPEPIHRLDYPTSGCLLIGKTSSSVLALNKSFQEKTIHKVYYAITLGKQETIGTIKSPIDGKESSSHFEVIATAASVKYTALNLVKLIPSTGRKHQLRKHLASLGNPIMGDLQYGTVGNIAKGNGLYLHAYSLAFTHPKTGVTISEQIPLPKKYIKIFKEGAR